jgi:DNA helicase-2/ATP-dependent DNA helicase PcrA
VWLAGLNEAQRRAVLHEDGPLLILAGAGTGKTRTLVCRLARLLATGTEPERILLVTFSRRAAEEMIRRVGALTDADVARRVDAGTFHAVAYRLLRRYGAAVGLGDGFSVLDQSDASELMALVRAEVLGTDPEHDELKRRFARPDTLVSVYSRVVNGLVGLEEVLHGFFPWCGPDIDRIRQVFDAYTARKRVGALLDFDDLLLYWRAAAGAPGLGSALAGLYDHVLVDEYQDTNVLQAEILRSLRGGNDRLTVVGDDAQAIYSFRAATVRNLLDFTVHYPGAATVALEHNYRSTQPILDLANAVVADLGEGFAKSLWTTRPGGPRPVLATCPDEASQADAVCDVVLEHRERGVALREQVVLFRSGHHSDLLEVMLRRRRIPFVKYGGLRFLEAAHIRDLVALLRLLDNPWDELAWHRVLLLLDGVGPARVRRLVDELGVHPRRDGGGDPVARLACADRPSLGRGEPAARSLAAALVDCRTTARTPGAEIERLRVALDPIVRHRYQHGEVRVRDLDRLGQLAAGSPSRGRLVADLTLDPPASTGDLAGPPHLDDDYLVLSTVHSAKGGEWHAVHLIHAADGMFPSDLATGSAEGVDEERRLFYVALTRAREHLHIYAPLRYHHSRGHGWGDRHGYAPRTRFLPPSLEHLLDLQPVRSSGDRAGADPTAATLGGIDPGGVDPGGTDLGGIDPGGVDLGGAVADALRGLW